MTRAEIVEKFRAENPDITTKVISNALLYAWAKQGDKEICAMTRCITDQDGTTITTAEDDTHYDLTVQITKFYDIDEFPGGGVTYNDDRLKKTTIAELDELHPGWRDRESGTPREYYRRGGWLYLDRAIDSNAYDLKVYAVLISDDFDDDAKTPYNQFSYLSPFHDGINKYLQWRAKAKVGKQQEAQIAKQEFTDYAAWMKSMITGGKTSAIRLVPKI